MPLYINISISLYIYNKRPIGLYILLYIIYLYIIYLYIIYIYKKKERWDNPPNLNTICYQRLFNITSLVK